jgi:hypothetical protein
VDVHGSAQPEIQDLARKNFAVGNHDHNVGLRITNSFKTGALYGMTAGRHEQVFPHRDPRRERRISIQACDDAFTHIDDHQIKHTNK